MLLETTRRRPVRRGLAAAAAAVVATIALHPGAGAARTGLGPHLMHVRPVTELGVAAGLPIPGNMVYGGGHVQVTPKIYLVFWQWSSQTDPVATLITNFTRAIGGTRWAGIQSQYYQTLSGGQTNITNPADQLAGVWFDNTSPIHDNLSTLELAQEAQRGLQHFQALGAVDLPNANFVVATPKSANDAGFNSGSYCAWHNDSENVSGLNAPQPFSFTNLPYIPNASFNCGQDAVNAAPAGDLDGVTIVLGHELEETVTNPGAWNANDTGWGDLIGNETGDKCAWVGGSLLANPLTGQATPIPGAMANVTMNDGRSYPVQSLWSNAANAGTGYCVTS